MQMTSMQECKERKIILHLQAIIRSLIVGITPVDLWTRMAEIQGHDSFTAINSLLTDEKQSNLYLLLFKTSVRSKTIRHPLLWGGSAVLYESAHSFMDLNEKTSGHFPEQIFLVILKHLEYNYVLSLILLSIICLPNLV